MKRNRKQQNDQQTRVCKIQDACHVLAFLTQTSTKYGIRGQSVAHLRTLPVYRLVVPTIKDFITRLRG